MSSSIGNPVFRLGLSLQMYNDSRVLKSYRLLMHFDSILELFLRMACLVLQWCSIMAEWFDVFSGLPVLTDTPKCSAIQHRNCLIVEPTYEELHSPQLYTYTTEEH